MWVVFIATVVVTLVSCVTTVVTAAPVEVLSGVEFQDISVNAFTPNPWVVRFKLPHDRSKTEEAQSQAFKSVAEHFPEAAVKFGEVVIGSIDGYVLGDANMVSSFPCIRMYHSKVTRPHGHKGLYESGRPIFLIPEMKTNMAKVSSLKEFVLTNLPTRYSHPITQRLTDSVNFILSTESLLPVLQGKEKEAIDMHNMALTTQNVKDPVVPEGVMFYFDLMKFSNVDLLGCISAAASTAGHKLAVFATEDQEVAAKFGLTKKNTAALFSVSKAVGLGSKLDKAATLVDVTETVKIQGAKSAAELIQTKSTEGGSVKVLQSLATSLAKKSEKDLESFFTKSPLRKIETTAQFIRDVDEVKAAVVVMFLLRESDDFFIKHHKTAVEVATWARERYFVNPHTKRLESARMRVDVYWADAEVSTDLPTHMKAQGVPAIGVLMQLQDQAKGIKYVESKTKGEWPSSKEVIAFLSSSSLYESNQGIVPFHPSKVRMNDFGKSAHPKLNTPLNNEYLLLDAKHYAVEEEKETDLLAQVASGKLKENEHHYDDDSSRKTKKKNKDVSEMTEKEKLKHIKAEAKKKQLEEEVLRKKQEKEERIRKKTEADKLAKEEALKKAEEEKKNKPKANKPKKKATAKKVADSSRPKLNPDKPQPDRARLRKMWADNGKMMATNYLVHELNPATGEKEYKIIDTMDIVLPAKKTATKATSKE